MAKNKKIRASDLKSKFKHQQPFLVVIIVITSSIFFSEAGQKEISAGQFKFCLNLGGGVVPGAAVYLHQIISNSTTPLNPRRSPETRTSSRSFEQLLLMLREKILRLWRSEPFLRGFSITQDSKMAYIKLWYGFLNGKPKLMISCVNGTKQNHCYTSKNLATRQALQLHCDS